MKIVRWLDKNFETYLVSMALFALVVVMSTQIFLRIVVDSYLSWTEEFARHLFICMTFIGISMSIKENIAIKFDLLNAFISKKAQAILSLLSYIIVLALFLALLQPSVALAERMSHIMATTLPYSMLGVYSFVVLSFCLVIVRTTQLIFSTVAFLRGKTEQAGRKVSCC